MTERSSREDLCAIGMVTKVFGLKGEVKISSYSRSLKELKLLKSVAVGPSPDNVRDIDVEEAVMRGEGVYLRFRGFSDRDAAAGLVGQFLFVGESARKKLPQGSFYVDDLVGMSVIGEDGRLYGTLRDILKNPGHDIFVVRTPDGDVLVPSVPAIVLNISASSRTIVLRPPEGMFVEMGGNDDGHQV